MMTFAARPSGRHLLETWMFLVVFSQCFHKRGGNNTQSNGRELDIDQGAKVSMRTVDVADSCHIRIHHVFDRLQDHKAVV